jgi:ribosomal protein S18 acetylase RimI-like enzyme
VLILAGLLILVSASGAYRLVSSDDTKLANHQGSVVVGDEPQGYASIQAALDAAPTGGSVRIAPGTYHEYVTISRPVVLRGAGWQQTEIVPPLGDSAKGPEERDLTAPQGLDRTGPAAPQGSTNGPLRLEALGTRPTVLVKDTGDVTISDLTSGAGRLRGLMVTGKRWNDRNDVSLRRARPEDAPALAQVHVDSWREGYRGIVPDAYLQGFTVERRTERFRQSLESDSEETYLAERGGRIVGFLTIGGCRDEDIDHATTGEIWGIYLAPTDWRKGIGRFLCGQGEKMLASRGFSMAALWVLERNVQARRFYEAMGFAADGVTKEIDLGARLVAVRYSKRLHTEEG